LFRVQFSFRVGIWVRIGDGDGLWFRVTVWVRESVPICIWRESTHLLVTGRIATKWQTAGIVFTHRPKIRFFAPQGRLVAPIAGPAGIWVRLAVQNFMSIGADGWECGPQNIRNFHFLGRGDSLNRFPKFLGAFIHLTILR